MKHAGKKLWKKLAALTVSLTLCLAPAAQALTADQLKDLLKEHYINEVPEQVLSCDTVDEILAALNDPYTVYMTKEQFDAFKASMEDSSVVGIGISAVADQSGLLVMGVYDGSPAQKLGLKAGDIITQVGENSAAGQTAETVTGWLKGQEGTSVTFTVLHADGTSESYTATRSKVVIPATTTTLLSDGTTGYIACSTFGSETQKYVTEGTKAYDDANMWIVDLRNNGGGDVYAVTQTLGAFLGTGTMVYLRDGTDTFYRYTSTQEKTTQYPVIVLTSGQTASSAEIFALAMKDQKGGMVIGSNTYGKGVAQVVLSSTEYPQYLNQGDAMKITAYQYYGVNGTTANHIGVIPDLLVNANDADEIASLFHPEEPGKDNTSWLRIALGGYRWYVNLADGGDAAKAPYLTELLEAIPPTVKVYQGQGTEGNWAESTVAQAAVTAGLKDYAPRSFSDLSDSAYATAINVLCTYGILRGYGDATFRPDNTLTRAELCALLVQAMDLHAAQSAVPFADVSAKAWYTADINAVCAAGYMNGVGNGNFDPNGTVSNEQMFTVLGRIAKDLNAYFYQAAAQTPADTGVPASYSSWSQPWVWLLSASQSNFLGQKLNMLYDDPAKITPTASTTRGETAQVLYTILNAISEFPS